MKRVLIIGSDFAPSSLPPATRIRFFASHLPEFGWEPIVLTTKAEFYDWPTDPENEKLLSPSLRIVRTNAWSPRWTRKIGFGDVGIRSLWNHWQALKRICLEQQIDLIFIPVPPYVPMILGRMAHRKFGIPYVVDYIDPWVTEYYWSLPRAERPPKWPLAYAMSRILEPLALKDVAAITGVSKGTTDTVIARYPHLTDEQCAEIPYGAELNDFAFLREHPRNNTIFDRDDGLFHLSYVGAFIPGMHSAARALLSAIRLGLKRNPEMFARLRLHFIGSSYAAKGPGRHDALAIAKEYELEDQVDEHGARVPYLDSLQIMLDSDGLVLLGTHEPHYTASKIFPSLVSQRPLLAIFHEQSSVIDILQTAGAGAAVVSYSSTSQPDAYCEQIFCRLSEMLSEKNEGLRKVLPSNLEPFTTRAMAQRLGMAFDRSIARDAKPFPLLVQQTAATNKIP